MRNLEGDLSIKELDVEVDFAVILVESHLEHLLLSSLE